jgi:hypothetical protein
MKDKLPMILGAVTVALFAVLASLQGCDIRSQLVVKAPKDVLEIVDLETMTLADADAAYEDWANWVDTRTRQFQRAVADAEDRYARIEALIDLGLTAAEQGGASLPGGAFLVGGLSLLTGLVLKRPGEDKRVSSEKQDSYNAGIEAGKKAILEALKKDASA